MFSSLSERNQHLIDLSTMMVDGNITHKLDFIGSIKIQDSHYFNVFRRYNSPYNFVIEDRMGDIYLQKDYTVRRSLQDIFCLSEGAAHNIFTMSAHSFKHNGPVPSLSTDLADMRWSEIHQKYQGVSVNFGGVFGTYLAGSESSEISEGAAAQPSNLPPSVHAAESQQLMTDQQAANILLTISIPHVDDPFEVRECDGGNLSMKFADIQNRKRKRDDSHISCHCMMNECCDDDYDDDYEDNYNEEEEFDESKYTILRNGTMIPKLNT